MSFSGAHRKAHVVAMGLAAALAAMLVLAARSDAQPFQRGFTDDVYYYGGGPQWVLRTAATGAKLVLVEVDWSSVESTPPPSGTNPTNPAGSQYYWAQTDGVVREFAHSGINVAFLVTSAPGWAEAPGGPANFEATGAWKPNAQAYGAFATALAERYSGHYPDPLNSGHALPRVRYYQAWGEANLDVRLAPQWTTGNGNPTPTGPEIYRGLLNAFYAGVKRVHSDNVVIATGLAPYGDPPGGQRMHPVAFMRTLLCLRQSLAAAPCPVKAHFDVLAADPYEVGPPTQAAFSSDDVSVPDLRKLTRVTSHAVADGTVLPRRRKALWVTEFSYDSRPPNPYAPKAATQARWLEQAFYLFWKQGVSTAIWYLVRDSAGHNYANSYFSGVYFYGGQRKPSFEAYRFPLVVAASGRRATVWGISPRSGALAVEHQSRGHWRTLFSLRGKTGAVFTRTISGALHGNFRAVVGAETSLVWKR